MSTKKSGNCRVGASVTIHSKASSRRISSITKFKEIEGHLCNSPFYEVETDQAKEESIKIIGINPDRESKFKKSDQDETFELKE
ncbi:hypothetical protein TNCV_3342201 [Trichonephila clavipes]|nr:hypothetical protein TNCV_3342201 [Trichonephila clavipes]